MAEEWGKCRCDREERGGEISERANGNEKEERRKRNIEEEI